MERKKVLLVEGRDDEFVVKNLCGEFGGPWIDRIVRPEEGGVEALLKEIPTLVKVATGQYIIGIIIDADDDIAGRWQALTDRLAQSGYQGLPHQPDQDGTIIDPGAGSLLPRIGVWLMPDNRAGGILEHFLFSLVPVDSPLFAHVKSSVASIPVDQVKFSFAAHPKVLLHTWLAWQRNPGVPYGTAIKSGYLTAKTPESDRFMAWLNRLYAAADTITG